jgi:hypothetical protein
MFGRDRELVIEDNEKKGNKYWTIGKKLPLDANNPAHGSLLRVNSPSHGIFARIQQNEIDEKKKETKDMCINA